MNCDRKRQAFRCLYFLALLLVALSLCGCRMNEHEAAVGRVSVSTPLFTPLLGAAEGDKRLSYGDLRSETVLAQSIALPSFSASKMKYDAIQAALSASFGTASAAPSGGNNTPPATSSDIQSKLVAMLDRLDTTYHLPQDDIATLIAAYKEYMINLEEYYNLDAYANLNEEFEDKAMHGHRWLPYKVHMTMSVDPGWLSEAYGHDGIADITFNLPDGNNGGAEFKVLTVMPAETAEAFQDLNTALQSFSTAVQAGAALPKATLDAMVSSLSATATQMQGLRTHTGMIVSYPESNTIRVRFRPQLAANGAKQGGTSGRDLQPTSRIMTALVLVRDDVATHAVKTGGGQYNNIQTAGDATENQDSNASLRAPQFLPSATPLHPREGACSVAVNSYFVPSGDGGFPGSLSVFSTSGRDPKPYTFIAPIPVWQYNFDITEARGYYWSDGKAYHAAVSYRVTSPGLGQLSVNLYGTTNDGKGGIPLMEGDGKPIAIQRSYANVAVVDLPAVQLSGSVRLILKASLVPVLAKAKGIPSGSEMAETLYRVRDVILEPVVAPSLLVPTPTSATQTPAASTDTTHSAGVAPSSAMDAIHSTTDATHAAALAPPSATDATHPATNATHATDATHPVSAGKDAAGEKQKKD